MNIGAGWFNCIWFAEDEELWTAVVVVTKVGALTTLAPECEDIDGGERRLDKCCRESWALSTEDTTATGTAAETETNAAAAAELAGKDPFGIRVKNGG